MNAGRRRFLGFALATAGTWACCPAAGAASDPGVASASASASGAGDGPRFRVAADGWGAAGAAEVEAVLRSAAGVLWRYFPGLKREPFVVLRGRDGPIVHYQRNVMGEIVMKLDTTDYLWCQYTYQFSHEFCHILCGFREQAGNRNRWFEETLCEAASLFVLRRLSDVWVESAPYQGGREYAPEFRRYAQTVMDSRSQVGNGRLGNFYLKNRKTLESTPRDRSLNGAMALPLLELLEGSPQSWEAVAWLNSAPAAEGDGFAEYLEKWRGAVPVRHREFVGEVMRRFGLRPGGAERAEPGAAGPTGPMHSRD
ncbi:MAG: hypothetical protein JWL81_2305 [Verrucomicrobiales bacterium]|nr:hypothetical protein [Verrucomicrobiales bacterium]